MKNVDLFYGHLVDFTAIRYILWLFGNVVIIWYIFYGFGVLCQEKSGNPGGHTFLIAFKKGLSVFSHSFDRL
jgi:hypothetical protein